MSLAAVHVADFVLNGKYGGTRGESYKYLGFVFHARAVETSCLEAVARKAMFAVPQRCAELGIRDPALQCKLFDTLVLSLLSSGVLSPA